MGSCDWTPRELIRGIRNSGYEVRPDPDHGIRIEPRYANPEPMFPDFKAAVEASTVKIAAELKREIGERILAMYEKLERAANGVKVPYTDPVRSASDTVDQICRDYENGSRTRQDAFNAIERLEGVWMVEAVKAGRLARSGGKS